MRFSQEFIERVSEANNLVDIISQYTQLKPSGSGLMGRCPFPDHQEKTPSFSVSEAKQVYHCFGCHKKGNIYTFLQNYQGMNFPEAIEYLANRANIPMPVPEDHEKSEQRDQALERKKALARVNKLAFQYFIEQLKRAPSDHPVKKYITKRGLSAETVEEFGIGYATGEWDGLEKYLVQKGVPLDLAEEARLVKARTQGKSGFYDIFRDRLMFPILSPMGEPVAFGGRIIEQGEPKYLNSPETPVFVKGKILYGLSQTARYIRSEDQALIVEGYMDLVSLYQAGVRHVVATMGTALTPDHGKLLKRLTKNVVALFDGDSAGMEAAERSLPILLAAELYPKGLTLPDGMDPDDFVKTYGAEALKKALDQAPDLFVLVIERWMANYRGEASEKVQLVDKAKAIFEVIPDPRLKDLYIEEMARRLGVSHAWLKSSLGPQARPVMQKQRPVGSSEGAVASQSVQDVGSSDKIVIKDASKAELMLVSLVLKSRANFAIFLQENMFDQLTHLGVKNILQRAADVYRQDIEKFDKLTSLLVSYVDRPELLFLSEPAQSNGEPEVNIEAENRLLKDCCKKVRADFLREQAKQLAKELKSGSSTEKLEQIMNVQRSRISLNKGS